MPIANQTDIFYSGYQVPPGGGQLSLSQTPCLVPGLVYEYEIYIGVIWSPEPGTVCTFELYLGHTRLIEPTTFCDGSDDDLCSSSVNSDPNVHYQKFSGSFTAVDEDILIIVIDCESSCESTTIYILVDSISVYEL